MSQHGPYPGQSWSNGPDEPYTEPADPWGDHSPVQPTGTSWGAHPTSMPPAVDNSGGYTPGGYPSPSILYAPAALHTATPVWAPGGHPAPPRRRNTPIVALVVVLGLLICGGLGTTAWLIFRDDTRALNDPGPSTSAGVTRTPTRATTAPDPASSANARFAVKGQCVRNRGTADNPDMAIVGCGTGTYEVLRRVDGKTSGESDAESKCGSVPDYTKWYFYDSELDSLDFVLCLRDR